MTFNSQTIIPEIRAEFDTLIEFVTNEQARTATADQIEKGLFRRLLRLGAKVADAVLCDAFASELP